MHIITGFVVAMLAGKLKKRKDLGGLPILKTGPVRVAHAIPGRLRFLVPDLRGCHPSDLESLQNLKKLPGITDVSASHISGSVVVTYVPKGIEPVMILMGLARVLGIEKELTQSVTPILLSKLKDIGTGLNRAVYEEAHGLIDLKTIMILCLITAGGVKIWRDRWAAVPAGATLLWWAMNSIVRDGDGNDIEE